MFLPDREALATVLPEGGRHVSTLAIGGFVNHRKPITLIQTLAHLAPNLRPTSLVILSASLDLDLALAAWPSIRTVHCPFTGIEGHATVSPFFRARYATGELEVPAWDTGLLARALATDPDTEVATTTGLGTDLPALNPWLTVREAAVWVRGLAVDLALLHLPRATSDGRALWPDSPWADALLWDRADQVIASMPQQALWSDP
ncbi:MAG: CoA transferase, partial [bacterium]